jgi:hypothetical protein
MQLIGKILRRLAQPTLDRLIAWRNAYPNTPLKYLPLPVQAEVKQILASALAPAGSTQDTISHPTSSAAGAQPIISPPVTTNGHASAPPANGTPRPAPARTILPGLRPQVPPITSGFNRGRQVSSLTTVIGTDEKTGEVTISQQAKQQGTYIVGVNGTGKTTLVENMILSDIRQGLGVAVVEPHGDLTAKILAGIPRHRLNDIIYLDVEDWEYPFGLNLFEVPQPGTIRTRAAAASFISHLWETIWNSGFETPRLMQNLRVVTRTLIANPGSTFADIPMLYANEEYRARMLGNLDNSQTHILTFWEEYERMNFRDRRAFTESTLNKVTAFLDEPMITHILSQSKTTINFRYIMDNSKILLIKLSPQFEEASRLIGAVIIGKILMTAFSRADTPEDKRVQFNLYCDEFHRFASSDFATLISESRKFKISTILSHQVLSQLPEATRASALGAGNLICFRVSGEDARVLSKSFNTTPSPIVIGEEVVRVPVADVISYLVRRGHHDPRVASFGTTYLANLERFLNKPPPTVAHQPQYSAYHHHFHTISLSERHVIWGREYLNECLYKAMLEKRSDVQLPLLSIYILAVSQGDGREMILSNWVEKSFHAFAGFKPGAEKFGKPSFVTPVRSQDYIAQITKKWDEKDVWMAEAIVTMLKETRYCMQVLSSEPIMGDTGRMQPRYQMQTHSDREAELSKELTIQENFKARVKLVNGAEYTITTKPSPETLSGTALTERIEAVKRHCRALGYTRHYTEVIEELRKRQEFLFGLGDTLDEDADDDGYDPDEPPRGSFTLD